MKKCVLLRDSLVDSYQTDSELPCAANEQLARRLTKTM